MKGGDSHKKIDLSANPVLRHYYHNKVSFCMVGFSFGGLGLDEIDSPPALESQESSSMFLFPIHFLLVLFCLQFCFHFLPY